MEGTASSCACQRKAMSVAHCIAPALSTHGIFAVAGMEMKRIDPDLLDDLRNEIELLKMMDHPNVIKVSDRTGATGSGDRSVWLPSPWQQLQHMC